MEFIRVNTWPYLRQSAHIKYSTQEFLDTKKPAMSCGLFCVGKVRYFFLAGATVFFTAGLRVLTEVVVVFLAVTFSPDSVDLPSLDS